MSKVWVAFVGAIMAIIGIIWSVCLHFWLAWTDSEYAKHDESIYATFQYFAHGGWIAMILVIFGFILYIAYKDE